MALTRELRIEMVRSGTYLGSKLELLDKFKGKRSELALGPLILQPWDAPPPRKAAKRRKAAQVVERARAEPAKTSDRPQRGHRVPATMRDFIVSDI